MRNHREKGGTGKLRSYWEKVVYQVVDKDRRLPVFLIKPKNAAKPVKRIHRNNIMGCNFLLPEEMSKPEVKIKKKFTRLVTTEEEESSEDEYVLTRFSAGEERREEASDKEVKEGFPESEELVKDVISEEVVDPEAVLEVQDVASEEESGVLDENEEAEQNQINSDLEESELDGTDYDESSSDSDHREIRRSSRNRIKPSILTYDTVGKPRIGYR